MKKLFVSMVGLFLLYFLLKGILFVFRGNTVYRYEIMNNGNAITIEEKRHTKTKNTNEYYDFNINIDKENYPDDYSTLRTIIGVQKKYDSIHNISPEYYGVSDSAKLSLVFSTFSNLSIPISSEKDSILDTKSFDGFISVDDKNTLCHGLSSSLEKSLLCYQRSLLKNCNQSKKAWDRYVEIDVRNAAVDLERKKLIKKLNNKRKLDNTYYWSNLLLRHQVTSDAMSKPLDEVNKKVTHRHEKSHFNPHVRK